MGGQFYITDNNLLTDISPLENLASIGGIMNIINNGSLTQLAGLENIDPNSITNLSINSNPQLSECDIQSICEYLVSPGGTIEIFNNASGCNSQSEVEDDCNNNCLPEGIEFETQAQIDNFQNNHPGCSEIEGDLTIGKDMNSSNITNLEGLDVLTSVGGLLDIRLNNDLESLAGLSNIAAVGGYISIYNNDALTSLSGLNNLTHIDDKLTIRENTLLPNLSGLENLTSIDGDLEIRANNALISISELGGLNSIGNDVWIGGNENLESLSGLEGLSSIEGYLLINYNYELIELTGLNNLTSIGGYLEFRDNYILPNLDGLENLVSIGGYLEMRNNDALENLDALTGLTSIGAEFRVSDNDVLTSLYGLDNIEAASISDLYIHDNAVLSACDIQSVCDYLADPNGAVYINNNASGCYDEEEVEEACFTGIEDIEGKSTFSMSPNPCSNFVNLRFRIYDTGYTICDLFEITGKSIKCLINEEKKPGTYNMEIELSDLPKGIYFCTLKTNKGIQTTKLIKL